MILDLIAHHHHDDGARACIVRRRHFSCCARVRPHLSTPAHTSARSARGARVDMPDPPYPQNFYRRIFRCPFSIFETPTPTGPQGGDWTDHAAFSLRVSSVAVLCSKRGSPLSFIFVSPSSRTYVHAACNNFAHGASRSHATSTHYDLAVALTHPTLPRHSSSLLFHFISGCMFCAIVSGLLLTSPLGSRTSASHTRMRLGTGTRTVRWSECGRRAALSVGDFRDP